MAGLPKDALARLRPSRYVDLHQFRWVVVNSSGGKDSMSALLMVLRMCDDQGYPRYQVVVSHQDLGRMEWEGTRELVAEHAQQLGLRLEISAYRDKDGKQLTLLDAVRRRRRWPSNKQRYCTSDFKRGPGMRVITKLGREAPGDVLNVFGFRAEESPARAKKVVYSLNTKATTRSRQVFDYLPIHDWTEETVVAFNAASGLRIHPAYALGMPRLSCCFCIFAPRAALMIAGRANPQLLDEYCALEAEIGHDFQNKKPIRAIREALKAGEAAGDMDGKWNM